MKGYVVTVSAVAMVASSLALVAPQAQGASVAAAPGRAAPSGAAPGGPGAQSYLGTSRKDCFGTAANTGSKAWYTVADGVLSDVYSPTIENSNDATLQYVVTDGSSFTALQQRDMTYTVSSPDPSGMVCEVTSTDAAHGFKLVSDYLTDPGRDSVIMQTRLLPLAGGSVAGLKVYARWDATIDNTGGGGAKNQGANDAMIDPATTALVASDTQAPAGPFAAPGRRVMAVPDHDRVSGFAGGRDGLAQLDAHHGLVGFRTASEATWCNALFIATSGWPLRGLGQRRLRRGDLCSARPLSASASRSARCSAGRWARSAGGGRSTGWPA